MKKKILTALAAAAAMFCQYDAAAGLIDHGDVTGFPNVNVDAHIVRIAKLYFPEARQKLPVGLDVTDNWVVQIWEDEILHKVKARNLNIPKEKLDPQSEIYQPFCREERARPWRRLVRSPRAQAIRSEKGN